MKQTIIILLSILLSSSLFAIPAYNGKRTAVQPDGTSVEYFVHGDEQYHYMTDTDGFLLEKDNNGYLIRAGVAPSDQQIQARRSASARHSTTPRKIGSSSLMTKGLVILVNFSDTKFQTANTKEAFYEMLNGDNYTYNGATGSVRKYYADQSDSAFVPTFDVYGPVTISNKAEWYGSSNYQSRVGKMVREAVDSLKVNFDIDFSEYDADSDGYVDFVDILYAGYGAADSDYENTVWPCEWTLGATGYGPVKYDGVWINTFSCHQELCGYGTSKGKRAGIGTSCHEFAHVFGLPDMYDTSYKNATLGEWDLMDQGAYNNEGRTPSGFSGYERMFAGWAKPRLINQPENILLSELQTSQEILIITHTGIHNLDAQNPSPTTFYIFENRQQTGWDKHLPGHGMLIWKIQYSQYRWNQNTVNTAAVSKQGVALVAADGKVYSETGSDSYVYTYGDSGDTYPGTTNVTSFNSVSNYPVTNISEQNGNIFFAFMGGKQDVFTVKFDVGQNGTCSTKSLKEATQGAGIILPAVIANEGYTFQGWSTSSQSLIADAGMAGDTYYPQTDITLYAVFYSNTINVEYDIENALVTPIGDFKAGEDIILIITPDNGFSITYDDIAITMEGVDLEPDSDFIFQNDTLIIPSAHGDIFILVIPEETGITSTEDNIINNLPFSISGNTIFLEQHSHINIFSADGRLVTDKTVESGDSETLGSGLYLLQIINQEQSNTYKVSIK